MKSPSQTIQYRSKHNSRPCEVRGCASPRYGVSNYCLVHRRANRAHGHPLGYRIWPRDIAAERKEVRRILREQPDYPGLRSGLSWTQALLSRGVILDCDEFERLSSAGVTARRIVEECAALWMYAHRNPARLDDDSRLTFALSKAVLTLAPRTTGPRDASRETRREIGEALRRNLGRLLHNLATEPDRLAKLPGAPLAYPFKDTP
jgi:hypothetical protein